MRLRNYLPGGLRLFIKTSVRRARDLYSGESRKFSSRLKSSERFEYAVSITQVIRKNENFHNKVHNLQQGIDAISGTVLYPQEIFSFWHHVGRPDRAHGFALSRNIVSGEVSEDYGGGLCQLSSIIYHLSLRAGLETRERFNHSVDIYKEEDRFTPLGADATVVYGYKDLRIRNKHDFPVMIFLEIVDEQLVCAFYSPVRIEECAIDFQRREFEGSVEVVTINGVDGEVLARSCYR